MREVDGIQAGSSIRRELDLFMTQIVYVTSHEQYAMDLFQNQPFDFVAEPVERERIFLVMKEYQRWYGHANLFYEFVSRSSDHVIELLAGHAVIDPFFGFLEEMHNEKEDGRSGKPDNPFQDCFFVRLSAFGNELAEMQYQLDGQEKETLYGD